MLEKEKAENQGKHGLNLSLDLSNNEKAGSIEEDAASKRVLLYKHVPYGPTTAKSAAHMNYIKNKGSLVTQLDIPTLVHRSIRQAQVDHHLLSPAQRIQQDIDDATAAAVAAATAVMSTVYGIRRSSVLITARGDGGGKGANQKGGRKESISQLVGGGGGGGGQRRESKAGAIGLMAGARKPSSVNAGNRSLNNSNNNSFSGSVSDNNTAAVIRPKLLMRVSVEGRRIEKEPTAGVATPVYDLNGR